MNASHKWTDTHTPTHKKGAGGRGRDNEKRVRGLMTVSNTRPARLILVMHVRTHIHIQAHTHYNMPHTQTGQSDESAHDKFMSQLTLQILSSCSVSLCHMPACQRTGERGRWREAATERPKKRRGRSR